MSTNVTNNSLADARVKVNGALDSLAAVQDKLVSLPVAQLLTLSLIVLFAAALRIYKIGEWSFWYDEIYTLRSIGALEGTSFSNPSISKLLISLVVNIFGTEEWVVRLVPALVGVITIPVLYFPVKRIFNAPVALLASLLLAISTWHLYWSQNARFYTTLLLFYTLGLFVFYFAIEKDKPLYLVGFLVLLGISATERLFAAFLVPTVLLYMLFLQVLPFEKPAGLRWRNLLIILIPGAIIGLILGWDFILDPARYLKGFGETNTGPLWILAGVIYYVGMPNMVLGTVGASYSLLTKRNRAVLLLSLAAVFPLLAVMALSLVQYSANRYIFVTLTSWLVLASLAVYELFRHRERLVRLVGLGLLVLLVVEPLSENILYYTYQNGNRDNWKEAFQLIEARIEPGDMVVVSETLLGDYYLESKTVGIESLDQTTLRSLDRRVWFVEDNNVGSKSPEKLKWIQANSRLVDNFDVHVRARIFKMRVYLYDPGPG